MIKWAKNMSCKYQMIGMGTGLMIGGIAGAVMFPSTDMVVQCAASGLGGFLLAIGLTRRA